MPELDDHELLAEFARTESEAAFAALVGRYVNLVYSAALRFAGNPHHAEEITQAVFIILARKAGKLSPRAVLSGWLYQTTRLTAANFMKGEIRRQHREQEAYMQSILTEPDAAAWQQLAPHLDEAMGRLGETDRDAIVLRFFENKTAREVGAALKLTEAAAHKRVNRALEKLRKIFSKRGVTLSGAIIAGAVSANSVQAAPVALAKTISAVAVAKGATASISTLTLIKGALKIMAWTKAKTAVVAVAAVVLAAGTTTVAIKVIHPSVGKFTVADLDANIAKLNHPGATVKEVVQVLGRPQKYMWNNKTIDPNNPLNTTYIMVYPQSVMVEVSHSLLVELRSEGNGRGFIWQRGLRLGSSLDEALQVLGPPSSSVVGKPLDFTDGVLYKDIEGQRGNGYYARADQKIRLFFSDDKVVALYVVVNPMK